MMDRKTIFVAVLILGMALTPATLGREHPSFCSYYKVFLLPSISEPGRAASL